MIYLQQFSCEFQYETMYAIYALFDLSILEQVTNYMEEPRTIQLIKIFLSSHLLQKTQIDIYQTDDTLLQRITIDNYDSKTIKIHKQVQKFYCIANSLVHGIEEQFQCDFKQLLKQNERPTIQKQFKTFKLAITVEITQQYRTSTDLINPQKTEDFVMSLALNNLQKLERKIMKRMELQQLKKPIKANSRIMSKNIVVKKRKTNICFFGTNKKRLSSQKKLAKRNSKKLQTAHQAEIMPIQLQDTENSEDNCFNKLKINRRGKHKTLTYKIEKMQKQNSVKQIEIKENKIKQPPKYQLIFQLFDKSLQEAKKISKHNRNKTVMKSYHNLLLQQANKDLQMQSQFLNVIHTSNNYLRLAPSQSRAKAIALKSLNSSPYKVSSTTFGKRKVY